MPRCESSASSKTVASDGSHVALGVGAGRSTPSGDRIVHSAGVDVGERPRAAAAGLSADTPVVESFFVWCDAQVDLVLELAPAHWQQTLEQQDAQQRLAANVFRQATLGPAEDHSCSADAAAARRLGTCRRGAALASALGLRCHGDPTRGFCR